MILLLLACAAPNWTREGAMSGVLAVLDVDANGSVNAAEYLTFQGGGPPFVQLDHDGDGALSARELVELVVTTDPTAGDPRRPPTEASMRASFPRSWERRMEAERSLFLREVRAAGGDIAGWPDPSEVAEERGSGAAPASAP